MPRRSLLAALAASLVALVPASAHAATAPANAPVLASAVFASPVAIQWTPGNDVLNVTQTVLRAPGPCTSPASGGQPRQTFSDNTTSSYSEPAPDGTYCYYIQSADLAQAVTSPGLTVVVDTLNPVATVTVAGMPTGGVISGTVSITGTAADSGSGIASSVLHVGGPGNCPAGPVVGSQWDSAALTNGPYDFCNVVTDKAGHTTTAIASMTIANNVPPPPVPPAPVVPGPPTKLTLTRARAKGTFANAILTLRWVNPVTTNLASVLVVMNLDHAPKKPSDGTKIYRGLNTSASVTLRAGQTGYLALYSYAKGSTKPSEPARTKFSLASLIPLRPLTGSILHKVPVLTWKPKKGSAYYNLQLYRNGKRVLVVWPSQASYRIPASTLTPGTYVWYVWPALRVGGASPAFASLIGRATFTYRAA
jgi:hypothetical protein